MGESSIIEMYVVMKLVEEISIHAGGGSEIHSGPIAGLVGILPVYATREEAYEASEEGLYKITTIALIK